MTDQGRVAQFESQAVRVPSRRELLESAIAFFGEHPKQEFALWHGVEHMPDSELRALKVAGTIVEPIDTALKAAGIATDGTIGGLLDVDAVTDDDLHALACDCLIGRVTVPGLAASVIFKARALRYDE